MEQSSPSLLASVLPLVVLFAIFYFLIIYPQQKQAKKHKEMVNDLKKGDKIVTTGGIFAEVVKTEEEFIKVLINKDVEVKLSRDFIAKRIDEVKS